jgi:hypothetical protein
MTLLELKAQAYDILSNLEYLQKKLQETNAAIGEKIKEQSETLQKKPQVGEKIKQEQETPKVDG